MGTVCSAFVPWCTLCNEHELDHNTLKHESCLLPCRCSGGFTANLCSYLVFFFVFSGPVLWADQHWHPSTGLHCAVWHRLLQPLGPLHTLLFPRYRLLWVCVFGEFTCSTFSVLPVCLLATSWKMLSQLWLKFNTYSHYPFRVCFSSGSLHHLFSNAYSQECWTEVQKLKSYP